MMIRVTCSQSRLSFECMNAANNKRGFTLYDKKFTAAFYHSRTPFHPTSAGHISPLGDPHIIALACT